MGNNKKYSIKTEVCLYHRCGGVWRNVVVCGSQQNLLSARKRYNATSILKIQKFLSAPTEKFEGGVGWNFLTFILKSGRSLHFARMSQLRTLPTLVLAKPMTAFRWLQTLRKVALAESGISHRTLGISSKSLKAEIQLVLVVRSKAYRRWLQRDTGFTSRARCLLVAWQLRIVHASLQRSLSAHNSESFDLRPRLRGSR
jgi:hypothetical protein